MGVFVSFEGGEGAGKTTQAAALADRLRQTGLEVVTVREPGGTPVGESIRRWVKGVGLASETELLLFAAARAQLVDTVIRPSLDAGKVVIADRYADSTVAYQGFGRRLPLDLVSAVNRTATGGLMPYLTVLLDQPAEEGFARVAKPQLGLPFDAPAPEREPGRIDEADQTRFEREGIAFHRRVRSGFLKLAGQEPDRILVVDATQPAQHIAELLWPRVQDLLGR